MGEINFSETNAEHSFSGEYAEVVATQVNLTEIQHFLVVSNMKMY